MLLVSSNFSNEKVVINDSSPEGTARINVVFDKGKAANVDPGSTVLFMGGG